jgi:hypothetical protein
MGLFDGLRQNREFQQQERMMDKQQQQNLIAQQLNTQTAYASQQPSKLPMTQEFHIARITFDEVILDFKNWLKGNIPAYDQNGCKFYESSHDRVMNDKGCNRVTSVVSSMLSKTIILGYMDDEQILVKMNYFMKEFSHMVCLNGAMWELDKTERTMLVLEVVNMIHSTLSRSLGGNEADQLSTAISRVENVQQNIKPQHQGFNAARLFGLMER